MAGSSGVLSAVVCVRPRMSLLQCFFEFCFQLVKDHSVLLVPGNYGFGAEGFIRIGYGESRKFEEAMSRVGDALENFLV